MLPYAEYFLHEKPTLDLESWRGERAGDHEAEPLGMFGDRRILVGSSRDSILST
jgi:hypothetical protein